MIQKTEEESEDGQGSEDEETRAGTKEGNQTKELRGRCQCAPCPNGAGFKCNKTPARRIACPQCRQMVGPGCCWAETTCHKCTQPLPNPQERSTEDKAEEQSKVAVEDLEDKEKDAPEEKTKMKEEGSEGTYIAELEDLAIEALHERFEEEEELLKQTLKKAGATIAEMKSTNKDRSGGKERRKEDATTYLRRRRNS